MQVFHDRIWEMRGVITKEIYLWFSCFPAGGGVWRIFYFYFSRGGFFGGFFLRGGFVLSMDIFFDGDDEGTCHKVWKQGASNARALCVRA